ncbi:MAG: hypothetical protein PF636_06005 [Actinomycetota bacterium]|nr:hypothetical protein [Actinomycetota bacterium]
MRFMIQCPNDGPVEVAVEDIDSVVLRDPEEAEVVFSCPRCGENVSVYVRIPAFLLSAMQALADEGNGYAVFEIDDEGESPELFERTVEDDARIEAYCEYFRRQLTAMDCVEDILAEIGDSRNQGR